MKTIDINSLECLEDEVWALHPIGVFGSNKGRCYLLESGKSKAHYTYGSNGDGYKHITWGSKSYKVHRLIAELFIPNPNNYPEVDHINRNKSDNRVENLRWATRSMQMKNRGEYKRPNAPKNNALSKQVAQIDPKTDEIIRIWESIMECERNGYSGGCVHRCCNNKYTKKLTNIYKGYKWQYYA